MIATNDSVTSRRSRSAGSGTLRDHLRRGAAGRSACGSPESAPQAMVMNRTGTAPGEHRAGAVDANSVTAGICSIGAAITMPTASSTMVPSFMNVRQVVARREQQPHRQHRGDEAVGDQAPGQRRRAEGERARPSAESLRPSRRRHREQQQHDADEPRPPSPCPGRIAQVDAHEQRDRDGRRDREDAPRAVGQRIDHDQRQHREQDDHDGEDADQRRRAADRADLVAAICPSDLPSRRMEKNRMTIVLHRRRRGPRRR